MSIFSGCAKENLAPGLVKVNIGKEKTGAFCCPRPGGKNMPIENLNKRN